MLPVTADSMPTQGVRSYLAVQPASTANEVPVTNVDSSDARNSAAAAISSGSAKRFIA